MNILKNLHKSLRKNNCYFFRSLNSLRFEQLSLKSSNYFCASSKILILGLWLICSCLYADIQPKTFTTPNNITIIFLPDLTTDLVSVNLVFKGAGSKNDLTGQEGLAFTSSQMLWRNSSDNMDRNQRNRKIKELGVIKGISFNLDQDNLSIQFKCPEENLLAVMNLIAGIITNSKLENNELNKLKNFNSIVRLETSSELEFAKYVLENKLFLGHPYGSPITGSPNSVQTLTLKHINTAISDRLSKNNLIISLVGNLDYRKIIQYADQAFVKLPNKAQLKATPPIIPKLDGSLQTIIKNSPQSGVVFALHAPPFKSKDFYPMLILNRILGNAFTGRLWVEIREKQGLAYEIGSSLDIRELSNLLIGYFKCDNKSSQKTIDLVKQEIKKLQTKGVTEQEVIDAKSGTIGEFALNFITTEQTSEFLLKAELLGRTIQEINNRNQQINSVTVAQVNKVAEKYLNPHELTMVLVGNPQ